MNIGKNKLNGTKYAKGKRKKKTDTSLLVCKTTITYLSHPEYKAASIRAQNRRQGLGVKPLASMSHSEDHIAFQRAIRTIIKANRPYIYG